MKTLKALLYNLLISKVLKEVLKDYRLVGDYSNNNPELTPNTIKYEDIIQIVSLVETKLRQG